MRRGSRLPAALAPALALALTLAPGACGESVTSFVPDSEIRGDEVWRQLDAPPVNLFGVSGSGPTDVILVGGGGTILRYDGTALVPQASGTTEDLFAVWAVSPTLAYAVGARGTRVQWDGVAWTVATTATDATGAATTLSAELRGVWADATQAFAVGENGTAVRLEGGVWRVVPCDSPDDLFAVLAVGGPIVAVGTLGTVSMFDGTTFRRSSIRGFSRTLAAIASGPGGTFVAGLEGALFRYDGSSFEAVEGMPLAFLRSVAAPGQVYVVGWDATLVRLMGGTPVVYEHVPQRWLNGVWAASNHDVWVVGASGLVLRGPPYDAAPEIDAGLADGGAP